MPTFLPLGRHSSKQTRGGKMSQIVEGHNTTVPSKSRMGREALFTAFQKSGGPRPPWLPQFCHPWLGLLSKCSIFIKEIWFLSHFLNHPPTHIRFFPILKAIFFYSYPIFIKLPTYPKNRYPLWMPPKCMPFNLGFRAKYIEVTLLRSCWWVFEFYLKYLQHTVRRNYMEKKM